ncbi:sulfatase-like hydrolase/transferase [Flavobacterium mekongense]|uniref:sulfatase-like hydrolase/transferase n=1 Tax=Flavobacterium mekongense TaxID=3379707 RepID=UPI00399B6C95
MTGIVVFVTLSFLLFVPRYAFNSKTTAFFPVKEFFPKGRFRIQPFFTRFNEDIFRLNWEYAFFVVVLSLLQNQIPIFYAKIILASVYWVTLIFFLYYHSIYGIYKSYPSFKSDYALIIQGFQIGFSGYKTALFAGLLLFTIVSGLVIWGNFYLAALLYRSDSLFFFCFGITCLSIFYWFYKKINPLHFTAVEEFEIHHFATIQWGISLWLSNRFFTRKATEDLAQIPELTAQSVVEIPKNLTLQSKPNICFIALESYGALLYENNRYRERYLKLLENLEEQLQKLQFESASILSETTVTGGASWVSYSSFLKGVKIKNDFSYRFLLNHQKDFKTQSVLSILNDLGYDTYLVAGIGGFETLSIEWEKIMSFLGTNQVIKYRDLEYQGETFNFGPSAPDQFLLNKARQLMATKSAQKPFAFFVETINSHYHFDSPTVVLPQWTDCQTAKREAYHPLENLSEQPAENYFKAIEYQLQNLVDFIRNDAASDTIYVVFGDHQPPLLTQPENSYQTPIHILSKETSFVQSWLDIGFERGLKVKTPTTTVYSHDCFKKNFAAAFFKTYKR